MSIPLSVLLVTDGEEWPFRQELVRGGYDPEISLISTLDDLDDAIDDDEWDILILASSSIQIEEVVEMVEAEQPELPVLCVTPSKNTPLPKEVTASMIVNKLQNLASVVSRVLGKQPPPQPEPLATTSEGPDSSAAQGPAPTASEMHHRAIAELAADYSYAIFVYPNGEDKIEWSMGDFERLTGYSLDEIDALDGMLELMHPDYRDEAQAAFTKLVKEGELETELPMITKAGDVKWFSNRFRVVEEPGSELIHLYCSGQEITARKRVEEKLTSACNKAHEAAKLKAAILANMSHEIRTPLTGVLGFASLLADEAEGEALEFAEYVERSGQHVLDTLDSVLKLARMEGESASIDLVDVDVRAEAKQVVDMLRPIAQEKGIELILRADKESQHALADRACVSRILTNLVGNGIKFTEKGEVEVAIREEGGSVRIEICDTGIGIDPEFLPALFDKFSRESDDALESHDGTGLGLAISNQLAELLGGRIEVESERPGGTTFSVILPAIHEEQHGTSSGDGASSENELEPVIIRPTEEESTPEDATTLTEEAAPAEEVIPEEEAMPEEEPVLEEEAILEEADVEETVQVEEAMPEEEPVLEEEAILEEAEVEEAEVKEAVQDEEAMPEEERAEDAASNEPVKAAEPISQSATDAVSILSDLIEEDEAQGEQPAESEADGATLHTDEIEVDQEPADAYSGSMAESDGMETDQEIVAEKASDDSEVEATATPDVPAKPRFKFDIDASHDDADDDSSKAEAPQEPSDSKEPEAAAPEVAEPEPETGADLQFSEQEVDSLVMTGDSLPKVESTDEAPAVIEPPKVDPESILDDRPAVLVVEDNPDTRMLLERILKRSYNVKAVGDARSALVLMNEFRFDGFVLDINLGGKETGVDILRVARTLPGYERVFAIALTAYALPGDRERFLKAGFNVYVSKPFTRSTLMAALADGMPLAV